MSLIGLVETSPTLARAPAVTRPRLGNCGVTPHFQRPDKPTGIYRVAQWQIPAGPFDGRASHLVPPRPVADRTVRPLVLSSLCQPSSKL